MSKKIANLIFSQNNVAVCNDIFWKQSEYFNVSTGCMIVVSDKACPTLSYKLAEK